MSEEEWSRERSKLKGSAPSNQLTATTSPGEAALDLTTTLAPKDNDTTSKIVTGESGFCSAPPGDPGFEVQSHTVHVAPPDNHGSGVKSYVVHKAPPCDPGSVLRSHAVHVPPPGGFGVKSRTVHKAPLGDLGSGVRSHAIHAGPRGNPDSRVKSSALHVAPPGDPGSEVLSHAIHAAPCGDPDFGIRSHAAPSGDHDSEVKSCAVHKAPPGDFGFGVRSHAIHATPPGDSRVNSRALQVAPSDDPGSGVLAAPPEGEDDIIPGLLEGLEETFKQEAFNWKDLERIYKASKYNRKAIRRQSSGRPEEAWDLWERSARLGNTDAMFNIAMCYETGEGREKDLAKASVHYAKAANLDHKDAAYNLALMHFNGHTGAEPNRNECTRLLQQAMDLGHVRAATELGITHAEAGNMAEARRCFEMAATGCNVRGEKDPVGLLFLAHTYSQSGGGDCGGDSVKADELYNEAAMALLKQHKKDDSVGFFLGQCYEHGWGVKKDAPEAASYYMASEHKDAGTRLSYVDSHQDSKEAKDDEWDDFTSASSSESNSLDYMGDQTGFRPTFLGIGCESSTKATDKPKTMKRRLRRSCDQQVPGDDSSGDDEGITFGEADGTDLQIDVNNVKGKVTSKGNSFVDDDQLPPMKKMSFSQFRFCPTDFSSSSSEGIPSWGSDVLDI